jgi:glycosyltransferase involved in cell wall biosynthesis
VGKVNLFCIFLRLDLGGAQEYFLRMVAHIDSSRFQITVCCLAERGRLVPDVESLGIRVLCLDMPGFRDDLPLLIKLARLIRHHNAHVVYTHLYSRASVYGRVAATLVRTPIIVVGEYGYGRLRSLKKRMLDRGLARFTDRFIAVSKAVKEHICREQGIMPDKVSVIYPGIDPEHFLNVKHREAVRQELGIPFDVPVVGTVARLAPEKGLADLIGATARIRQVVPGTRLMLVGDGPSRPELEQRVGGMGLCDVIHFTGIRRDIPDVLQAMDVFALPSLREGLPKAILEAMAAGLPVVATAVGGIPEVVEYDVTGFLVPPRDIDALTLNICRLLENSALRVAMGQRGRARVQQHFTARRAADQTQELYLSLLARKGLVFPTDTSLLFQPYAS